MMMLLQQSNFCVIPSSQFPSLKQRNPLLHQQKFSFNFPRKAKASTFRISSLGSGIFNDIAPIAHNKVLIAAVVSMAIGQLSKPFTSVFLYGKEFDIKALVQAGGFPSSHSSATVACATLLGLERGLSDPIFGLAVVYAGLVMYDAQGVRREVGIHARTMNKLLLQLHINYLHSKHGDSLINSQPGSSNPPKVSHEKSLVSQETTANAFVAVKSEGKIRQSDEELLLSSELFSEDAKEISKFVADGFLPLKESVGHTEVEVVAGGLLGFLVGLAVYNFK
ncbi:uncharacterized protein LOC123893852 [Trifolium pratense]|uniref:uncharacterized protein LOC123893852 n=1 Tax=Trifolium pratense TaxID=57577 RepID=UPI001E691E04|nr:uncharacterized protein LOC123893852 [Trifolium pratense]